MVGQPFNPNTCVFLFNQALNTNQFNSVPNSANTTVHTVIWDFIASKIYWVDAKTNLIQYEIPDTNAGNLFADIAFSGQDEGTYTFTANPSGGTGPYTYQWSIESSPNSDWSILGINTNQSVDVTTASLNSLSLIRCKVTDSQGRITSASHLLLGYSLL